MQDMEIYRGEDPIPSRVSSSSISQTETNHHKEISLNGYKNINEDQCSN